MLKNPLTNTEAKSQSLTGFLLDLSNLSSAEIQVLYSSPQSKDKNERQENKNEKENRRLASKHFCPRSDFSTIHDLHRDIIDYHLYLLSR